jgi:hypothetical protein
MDTAPPPGDTTEAGRFEARRRCLVGQAAIVAEARASYASGRAASSEEVGAGIDRLDTNGKLPALRCGQ